MKQPMPTVFVNYNYSPLWLEDYPEITPLAIYDRSDDGRDHDLLKYGPVFKTPNLGDVDYDKLGWLIENYHNLPEVFLWSKTNIFKFTDDINLRRALEKREFTPLTKNHQGYSDQYGVVCYMTGDWYYERNDSWYANNPDIANRGVFPSFGNWAKHFRLPSPNYLPFAPGGSYLLTRERVQKYNADFYAEMRDTMNYARRPVEAQYAERSYGLLWKDL